MRESFEPALGKPLPHQNAQWRNEWRDLVMLCNRTDSAQNQRTVCSFFSLKAAFPGYHPLNSSNIRKFKGQLCVAVLLVVLFVIGVIDAIVGFNLKENMANHFQVQEKQAKQRIDDRLASLDDDVKQSLAQIDIQMRSNIARNFETPAIQAIIENVAKAEAKGILETEVRPAVDSF